MTREEAIRIFENWAQCKYKPTHDAAELAVAALRAQQVTAKPDRSLWQYCPECEPEHRGCQTCVYAARREELEPCKSCVKRFEDSEGEESPGYVDANYCAHCGRPLTEEAWAEQESRIGRNDRKETNYA